MHVCRCTCPELEWWTNYHPRSTSQVQSMDERTSKWTHQIPCLMRWLELLYLHGTNNCFLYLTSTLDLGWGQTWIQSFTRYDLWIGVDRSSIKHRHFIIKLLNGLINLRQRQVRGSFPNQINAIGSRLVNATKICYLYVGNGIIWWACEWF